MTLSDLSRLLKPLRNGLANMVARAVVHLVSDGQGMQVLQLGVLTDETREGIERFQEYGLSSVPLEGAEAVALFLGGRRDHGIVIAVDDRRYRLKGLQGGEVALYHKDGASVLLKADGSVQVNAKPGADVVLNGGSAQVARVGDAVAADTTMTSWITAVTSQLNVAGPVSGASGALAAPADFGKCSAGASKVKA